jgi:hypothetical protein
MIIISFCFQTHDKYIIYFKCHFPYLHDFSGCNVKMQRQLDKSFWLLFLKIFKN